MQGDGGPRHPVRTFAETDYCFGAGPLTIAVERIDWSHPVLYGGENWYEVDGIEQTVDGRAICRRQALVKASRLSALMRHRRPRPDAGGPDPTQAA